MENKLPPVPKLPDAYSQGSSTITGDIQFTPPTSDYDGNNDATVTDNVDTKEDDWSAIANGSEKQKTNGVERTADPITVKPVNKEGYTIPTTNNDVDITTAKPVTNPDNDSHNMGIWEETKVKYDLGDLTKFRAQTAKQVWSGKLTPQQAKAQIQTRQQEILNKYGISKAPEFSFEKFKKDPLRTVIGESAQMLPFYADALQKGAAYSAVLGPVTALIRGKQGQTAGAIAGTVAEPGAGTIAGAATGRTLGTIGGLVEGVNNGMLVGTFHTSMEIEGMNLYMDLREKGISDKTAKTAGLAGGLINGILETASFGFMTAPIKGAAKKAAAKMLWKELEENPIAKKAFTQMLTKVTTEYLKRIGAETSTEMLQDVVTTGMQYLSAQADSVESAKPTAEDWKNIITKTGPQTAAAMLLMGLVGTPFDISNANVGSIKGENGEIGTKSEIEQNIKNLSEGKAIDTSGFTLQSHISYNTELGTESGITEHQGKEIDAEINEQNERISNLQGNLKKATSEGDQERIREIQDSLQYEQDYAKLLKDEKAKTQQSKENSTSNIIERTARKNELETKSKNEILSIPELKELNEIHVAEKIENEKAGEKVLQGRKQQLDTDIRNIDGEIEKAVKEEDIARKSRTDIETKQDRISSEIAKIEKENSDLSESLKGTDIPEDVAQIKTEMSKNKQLISQLKKQHAELEKQRLKLNKAVEAAGVKSDKLGVKRGDLDAERSAIIAGEVKEINPNSKVQFTAKQYVGQRVAALKKTLAAFNHGVKQGVRLTRREIRDVQNSVISLVKDSDMPPADKSKFLTTIRNIQTQDQLKNHINDIISKINMLEEKANRKACLATIGKLLKRADLKRGGKTPQGKFNADIQRVLDKIREYTKLSKEEAQNRIENLIQTAIDNDRELTDIETEEIRLADLASGLKEKSAKDLLRLIRVMKMLIDEGKIAGELRELAEKQHKEEILEQSRDSINGNLPAEGKRIIGAKEVALQKWRTLLATHDSWDGLMNILSQHDKTRKLAKILDVFPAKIEKIKGTMSAAGKFRDLAMKALNVKSETAFLRKLEKDSKVEKIGKYTDQNGKTVTLEASRAEARKLYMEMLDPSLKAALQEGNKYTFREDVIGIDKSTEQLLNEFLTPQDKKLAEAQIGFYREYYNRANSYYRERYGVDMPFNENYSPVRRDVDMDKSNDNWLQEAVYRMSIQPTSFKARSATKAPIALRSDIAAMEEHIATTEHFIAFDRLVRDMDTIFKNKNNRKNITEKYGGDILKLVDQHIADIKRDGFERTRTELKMFDKFRVQFSASMLGLKAQIALKQVTGMGVFALGIPPQDYITGVSSFFANPIKAVETLSQSAFLKDRSDSLSLEIRDAVRSQEFSMITNKRPNLNQILYFWTQLGDKASIYVGGWSVYQHSLKETGNHEAAIEAFERAADKYQQSGHIDQLSAWQRGNGLQKMFVMFMSDQMKQLRTEVHTVRDALITKDPADMAKAIKTVAICHFVLPNLVQFISNAFQWDDEDQLRATIIGPLNSIAVLGDVINLAVEEAIRLCGGDIDNFQNLNTLFYAPAVQAFKAIRKLDPEDITLEDLLQCADSLTKETVGPAIGLPLKYVINVGEKGYEYVNENEFQKLGLLLMGWSPYIIEKKGQDNDNDDE